MEKKTDFKVLSTKAKFGYIWDYYRWPIVIAIALIAFAGSLIRHYATYKEPLLNAIMVNCENSMDADASGFDEFLESYGYDPIAQPISLSSNLRIYDDQDSTSYTDRQVLTMMIASGGQDLFFGTGDIYTHFTDQGALMDLSTILPAEVLERYSDNLIYSTADGTMDPFPCAVELTDNEWLVKNNYYSTCYFGIFNQAQQPKAAEQFAEFLLNYGS